MRTRPSSPWTSATCPSGIASETIGGGGSPTVTDTPTRSAIRGARRSATAASDGSGRSTSGAVPGSAGAPGVATSACPRLVGCALAAGGAKTTTAAKTLTTRAAPGTRLTARQYHAHDREHDATAVPARFGRVL